ncbi:gluconokinase [Novosphingobium sp. MBES04]|uniref:gluconokinase n=1 Tax=Novosphingobium sp. MBES04 TaxID=1206458 RepID=UPI00057C9732|nr:gluconokinase [Novosphingobium sp. MBES04]GAM05101.1 gluconokinase [Novosphingobium sp. MBES04]
MSAARAIVVMGPSGCGKTTLASALARQLGWAFIEGDELHPEANRAKMAAGLALDDTDRAPFLDAVAHALAAHPQGAVASCSALKRSYRDRLRAIAGDVLFVLPQIDAAGLEHRMTTRPGHFMPVSLLTSQLATLEPPAADENACPVDGHLPSDEQVALVCRALHATGAPPG